LLFAIRFADDALHRGCVLIHVLWKRMIDMNQISQISNPLKGAAYMVGAGIAFAAINVITQTVTGSADFGGLGFKPTSDAFWQYFIGLIVALPFIWKYGLGAMKTQFPVLHLIRVALSGLGVLAFVLGLSHGVQIWQVIALVMTSPFFILLGAKFFLGEDVGADRWFAAALGFTGAMIVLQPWSSGFNAWSLTPIAAAVLWSVVSLITKKFTNTERAETVTMWLLIGITIWNGAFSVAAGFEWPRGNILYYLLAGGVIQFFAQWFFTKAYSKADASFLQPFDDLRLPFNVIAGFLAFHYLPVGNLWIGIAMIMAASAFLLWRNNQAKFMAV
jgi:drug/metabolite transporter (DMT)-like permease